MVKYTDMTLARYVMRVINGIPDSESCEAFIYGAGHKINDCEWMVTKSKFIVNGN